VLLRPGVTAGEVDDACAGAVEAGLAAVVVWPGAVARAAAASGGSGVTVVAAVGGPSGTSPLGTVLDEVRQAVGAGAGHLAVALDAGRVRGGGTVALAGELGAVCRLAHAAGVHVRVVLQAHLLDEGELATAARLAVEAGADLLQTGSGVEAPATAEQVRAIRRALPSRHAAVGVVAGGAEDAGALRDLLGRAGAERAAVLDPAAVLRKVAAA